MFTLCYITVYIRFITACIVYMPICWFYLVCDNLNNNKSRGAVNFDNCVNCIFFNPELIWQTTYSHKQVISRTQHIKKVSFVRVFICRHLTFFMSLTTSLDWSCWINLLFLFDGLCASWQHWITSYGSSYIIVSQA